jgi:hypothetical protein
VHCTQQGVRPLQIAEGGGHSSTFNLQFHSAASAPTVRLRRVHELSSHPRDIGAKLRAWVGTCRGLLKETILIYLISHDDMNRLESCPCT